MNGARILFWSLIAVSIIGVSILCRRKLDVHAPVATVSASKPALRQSVEVSAPPQPSPRQVAIAEKPVQKPASAPALASTPKTTATTNAPDTAELLRELRAKAAKDPEKVLAEVMKLPPGDQRDEALKAVCYGVAQDDPAAALSIAQKTHLDQQPGAVMDNIVQQWGDKDLASAYAWVNQQPAGSERDGMMTRIAYLYSKSDPSDAANLIMQQMSPGEKQTEAAMMVLHQWGLRDMSGAAAWVATFPDGPLRERALKELEGIQKYQEGLASQN